MYKTSDFDSTLEMLYAVQNSSETLSVKLTDFAGHETKNIGLNDLGSIEALIVFLGERKASLKNRRELDLRVLIEQKPADVKLLKAEYKKLTGRAYRAR